MPWLPAHPDSHSARASIAPVSPCNQLQVKTFRRVGGMARSRRLIDAGVWAAPHADKLEFTTVDPVAFHDRPDQGIVYQFSERTLSDVQDVSPQLF